MRGVDPEFEQRKFLSQRIMMANYGKAQPLGRNFAHKTYDWDEYVCP